MHSDVDLRGQGVRPGSVSGALYPFGHWSTPGLVLSQVPSIAMFTMVFLSGRPGPLVQTAVEPERLRLGLSVFFVGVGVFVLFMVL